MVPNRFYSPSIREKCAVFGIYGKGLDVARLTYFGLYSLQHRGQESSGIVVSNGKTLQAHRGMGLVAQVYREDDIATLQGSIAIGHNRYSTSKGSTDAHMQPVIDPRQSLALAHNGNLPSTHLLEDFFASKNSDAGDANDSEMMELAIRFYLQTGSSLPEAVAQAYPLFTGAFALVAMTKNTLVGVRDACGIRPLSLGSIDGGYVIASETCALDTVGAEFIRDVAPGEMVVINSSGLTAQQLAPANQKLDIFEFIYFARPDSLLLGQSVDAVRQRLGHELAHEASLTADIVIPIPDSATPAALGYSHISKIPYYPGLIKNRYIGRTFIQPEQHLRDQGVRLKLNPVKHVLAGKRVVVVDDSLVRGTTLKRTTDLLRTAGAKQVHVMISSPPYRYPDFYGIDTPNQTNLMAASKSVEAIRDYLGADSLHYLSYEGLIRATGLPQTRFSTPCFNGEYPIDIGERRATIEYNFVLPRIATVL